MSPSLHIQLIKITVQVPKHNFKVTQVFKLFLIPIKSKCWQQIFKLFCLFLSIFLTSADLFLPFATLFFPLLKFIPTIQTFTLLTSSSSSLDSDSNIWTLLAQENSSLNVQAAKKLINQNQKSIFAGRQLGKIWKSYTLTFYSHKFFMHSKHSECVCIYMGVCSCM